MAGPWTIAVDGPAASGKGTLARGLARAYHLAHLDTGLLYRAVGLRALQQDVRLDDEPGLAKLAAHLQPTDFADQGKLRTEAVASAASKVSALQAVRAALLEYQRGFAATPPAGAQGAVLDGRDVGTVVCPAAHAKLFVTGSAEVRAARRASELRDRGDVGESHEAMYARILQDIRTRDARDSSRAAAPLVPAVDALLLDTTSLDIQEVLRQAVAHVGRCCPGIRRYEDSGGQ